MGIKDAVLFDAMAQSVVFTHEGNLLPHHVPLLYNAFAKIRLQRKDILKALNEHVVSQLPLYETTDYWPEQRISS